MLELTVDQINTLFDELDRQTVVALRSSQPIDFSSLAGGTASGAASAPNVNEPLEAYRQQLKSNQRLRNLLLTTRT